MSASIYLLIADATLLLHAVFVAFVVGGEVLILLGWMRGWRWTQSPRMRRLHLAAVGVVVFEAWLGIACPLTRIEDALRLAAATPGYAQGFIGDWVARLLYYQAPVWVFTALYSGFAALVVWTYYVYPPRMPCVVRDHR